jgi:hypothetical protein
MFDIQKQLTCVNRPKYIKKAVQLPNGVWALVVFELIERDGQIVARAVSGQILNETELSKEEILCLPGIKSPADFIPVRSIFLNLVSDFSKDFSFVMSQPTRAPNFC